MYSVFRKFNINLNFNNKFDINKRRKFFDHKDFKNEDKLLFSLIIDLLPTNYLENFKFLFNSIKKNYSTTKLLYVEYFDDPIRFLAAQIKDNNGKLILAQHGGNYWALKGTFFKGI